MKDPRLKKLARLLVNHSCRIQPGEKCLIQSTNVPVEFIAELIEAVYEAEGHPVVDYGLERINRSMMKGASAESLKVIKETQLYRMKQMDAFIGVRGYENSRELSDLPHEQTLLYEKSVSHPVHTEERVPNTKWVVLRYPTPGMAMMAGMSTEKFEEYYFAVTTGVNYIQMEKAMQTAKTFMKQADKVHIKGPGTDLKFSIKEMNAIPCVGLRNIPDGEIYTAPLKESVEGVISYNTPSTRGGFTFKDICLTFDKGKIIKAEANDTERINAIFDTDEGARYVGEFSFGCNPNILTPMDETLFDEKIAGSFHFTPGNAYKQAFNGNKSSLHWDLVLIQRPEFGGGTIEIDGEIVRKNGVFVHPAFKGMNPENLKSTET